MSNRRLLWHLFPSYGAIAALAVLFVGWVALGHAEKTGLSAIQHELRARPIFSTSSSARTFPPIVANLSACAASLTRPRARESRCYWPTAKWTSTPTTVRTNWSSSRTAPKFKRPWKARPAAKPAITRRSTGA